jgi:hypothetical protein
MTNCMGEFEFDLASVWKRGKKDGEKKIMQINE